MDIESVAGLYNMRKESPKLHLNRYTKRVLLGLHKTASVCSPQSLLWPNMAIGLLGGVAKRALPVANVNSANLCL